MTPRRAAGPLLAVLLSAAGAAPLDAQQARLETQAETFRRRLVDALARGDRRGIANMVRYRLTVNAGVIYVPIVDRATLLQLWDVVFPPEVRCLIEESRLPSPGAPAPRYVMRVDAGGVFMGDNRIRADRGADGLKITRMTLPPGFGASAAGKPRPVIFKWGKGRVKYAGRLSADNVDVYLVTAHKGDILNAQLERVPARSASLRVVQQASNRELPAPGPSSTSVRRLWAGVVPDAGEYRVEVVRLGAYCDPAANYQLVVSLE